MKQMVIAAAVVLALASTAALAEMHAGKKTTEGKSAEAQSTEVRDWSKIDTNKDGLVSPEEMEKFLASKWQGKKTASK